MDQLSQHTVLIPAYNARLTIEETLDSIQKQDTSGSVRIVVADDASTDETVDVVTKFFEKNKSNSQVWRSERNGGERKTVNMAFERLRNEGVGWCFVLHADDVAKPDWLSTLALEMKAADQNTVSICSSWDDWYADRIEPGEDRPGAATVIVEGGIETAAGTLSRGCWWHFSGCAMHLENFFAVGGFCEDMPQLGDLEWLIRASQAGFDIRYIPRTLIKYRQIGGNVSSVSFKTNRDLRESWVIARRHGRDVGLETAIREYATRQSKSALRRSATSLLRGNIGRSLSAARLALKLWAARR